ncbi:Cof-type HAD-IIB family hydrolase [Enterococcus dongliensis]|uniref:Cof-type HAD-IIB family hydrolase n=1 Tax=Enterococcus dongliensis TaxID=2559925 RepID=UPI00288E7454|nr:Cof-type HAD-IIB family hydrolase [Enterococcus dongliensis]MDT2614430.1 Cof-type HAD-IIB family hydrolase [Enterococcus dongliensis]MDT2673269.1 Cof-type HAD-IIB family hydrolase [Enterococcus dongliensis]
MKKLIAIDLDGTTLNQDSKISDKTVKTLHRAIEDGHSVVIATGRPYRMSKNFYRQLQLTTPMINFNGALVHLPGKTWAGEQETSFNRKIVFDLISEKKNLKLDFIAAENRETFFIDDLKFFDQHFFASDFATNDNLLTVNTLKTNPTSVLLRSQPENVNSVSDELKQQFGHEVEVNTWGGPNPILEVVAKGIQKAHGLKRVIENLNLKSEDILAFGDEHNDVDMLKFAGWGVAMANGTDQLKAVADDITEKPNTEDGLADYLTKYLDL